MPTPFESARLNLQLFDLRREPVLREARSWFLREFNPESLTELAAMAGGERNAWFRIVLGYWDMAASLVTTGAIRCERVSGRARRDFRGLQQDSSFSRRTAQCERRA
ncbi:MAG TPA: hypothetical protein VG297_25525 [Bryobacteraceae bacterium]|nr:hypothetical protein [Bryobacteraceae bacterium]